jgi:hypothetical protein
MNFRACGDGGQFFSSQGARSDRYQVYLSDEQRGDEENWPRPTGLRKKSGRTLLSSSTVVPPQPSDSALSGLISSRNAARPKGHGRLYAKDFANP